MEYNIFISYADPDKELIENFKDHLKRLSVNAWVYSLDRTLAGEMWTEIEERIRSSRMVIFTISRHTQDAEGQKVELQIALEKVEKVSGENMILPIVLRDTPFSALPDKLKYINGERLDAYSVKTVAWRVAKRFFPKQVEEEGACEWRFPVPGQWLEVSDLHEIIEEHFDIGDKLYFRTISPIGLFECYAPKVKGLFWIAPEWVKVSTSVEDTGEAERTVPFIYRVSGMVEIQRLGWDVWHKRQEAKSNTA